MFVASSLTQFKQRFADGLAEMLTGDALGAYILVLANSLQAEGLHVLLSAALKHHFLELKSSLADGTLRATADDIEVFEKLQLMDPDALKLTQQIEAGDWLLLLNTMRALRPARAAAQIVSSLQQAFDPEKFNFNKVFLRPEIFWQGSWQGTDLRVLYNKFPLAAYHCLVVPDAEQGLSQFLSREYHALAADIVLREQQALPGLYFGYNSLGAYASVNHLHFHAVIRQREFPVEAAHWSHRGGQRDYPLALTLYESAESSWQAIENLHAKQQAYNVLYTHYGIYVLPRHAQNTVVVPECMQGAGWPELCGEITLSALAQVENAPGAEITRGLGLLSAG